MENCIKALVVAGRVNEAIAITGDKNIAHIAEAHSVISNEKEVLLEDFKPIATLSHPVTEDSEISSITEIKLESAAAHTLG